MRTSDNMHIVLVSFGMPQELPTHFFVPLQTLLWVHSSRTL